MARKSKTELGRELYEQLLGLPRRLYVSGEIDEFFEVFDVDKIPVTTKCKTTYDGERRIITKYDYYNIPTSYDIETTSAYINVKDGKVVSVSDFRIDFVDVKKNLDWQKLCWMYAWMVNIAGVTFLGRDWDEFDEFYSKLVEHFGLHDKKRLVLYVHNLGFEFEFLRKHLAWSECFALDKLAPVKCVTRDGVEFRCSYKLSNANLETVGSKLEIYKQFGKKTGDLDYNLLRHSKTVLSDEEIGYCVADVETLTAYVMETMLRDGSIIKIPMTSTSYVRQYCRKACLHGGTRDKQLLKARAKYMSMISALSLSEFEYKLARHAFAGGFTHTSQLWSGDILENVQSLDFTSFYPTIMVAFPWFPMSAGRKVEPRSDDEFQNYLKKYCCLFTVRLHGVEATTDVEHVISYSKCYNVKNAVYENGRIVKADEITLDVTDMDYKLFANFYTWKTFDVANMYIYRKGYLPTELVQCVLKFYADKTTLKDVAGREDEYSRAKALLNSVYGMCVTDVVRCKISYNINDNEWNEEKDKYDSEVFEGAMSDQNRFLSYLWGVWVTAIGRYLIGTMGILQFGKDYCYCDTDSAKILNPDKHVKDIENYNRYITGMLEDACKYHGIDVSMTRPRNTPSDGSLGKEKPMGVWSDEGIWKRARFRRSKCYAVQTQDDEIIITISGVNKRLATPHLLTEAGVQWHALDMKYRPIPSDEVDDAIKSGRAQHYIADSDTTRFFVRFDFDLLELPAGASGTTTHTIINREMDALVTDYQGVTAEIHEKSGIHIEGSTYVMSDKTHYLNYIWGVRCDSSRYLSGE